MTTLLDVTRIPAPRVPVIDPRTGEVSREWYRFFENLFLLTGAGSNPQNLNDLQKGPRGASVDELSPIIDKKTEDVSPSSLELVAQIAELQKQVDALKLQLQPELGTMASVQQDNVRFLGFSQYPSPPLDNGLPTGYMWWNNADSIQTLDLRMNGVNDVVQHIGEETYYRVRATAPISDGDVVMFTGTVGASGGLLAAPATGLGPTDNERIMGVATEAIPLNGWGYVTWFGEVKRINTTGGAEAWADGDILYYNPAVPGGLTKNVPTAPNPKVIVAAVVHAANNGILFVRPTFGSSLGATDSNVEITGLADTDLLQYVAANSRWENVLAADVIAAAGGPPVVKTADFTVADGETWIINNKAGSTCTATLPSAAANVGRRLSFQNYQDQLLVSAASNVVPLAGGAASTSILLDVAGAHATLVSDGTNWVMTQYGPNSALLLE